MLKDVHQEALELDRDTQPEYDKYMLQKNKPKTAEIILLIA